MIKIHKLKRKARADEYIGTRIDEATKRELDLFCENERLSKSTLLTALIEDFLKSRRQSIKDAI